MQCGTNEKFTQAIKPDQSVAKKNSINLSGAIARGRRRDAISITETSRRLIFAFIRITLMNNLLGNSECYSIVLSRASELQNVHVATTKAASLATMSVVDHEIVEKNWKISPQKESIELKICTLTYASHEY